MTMKQGPFEYFLKFAWRSVFLLKFCQIREILNFQFLLIVLKCIVVGYSNGKNFTGRLFSNYELLNMLFHFFWYLIYSVFHEAFVKKFMQKLSFFNSNFKNQFQDVVHYRKLGLSNFVILKWLPFEYNAKS